MKRHASHRGAPVALTVLGFALSVLEPRSAQAQIRFEMETGPRFAIGEEPTFRRGEINGDRRIDMSDTVSHLGCLFLGDGSCTACLDARDVDDDARVDVSDAVALLFWLFGGRAPPPEPFETCGWDSTPDPFSCPAGAAPCE